jgi:hypothetical protein
MLRPLTILVTVMFRVDKLTCILFRDHLFCRGFYRNAVIVWSAQLHFHWLQRSLAPKVISSLIWSNRRVGLLLLPRKVMAASRWPCIITNPGPPQPRFCIENGSEQYDCPKILMVVSLRLKESRIFPSNGDTRLYLVCWNVGTWIATVLELIFCQAR